MRTSAAIAVSLVMILAFTSTGYGMQWNILNHPENRSVINWKENARWVVKGKISTAFIVNENLVNELHAFKTRDDEGTSAISRRWHLIIEDLPQSAWWPHRSVQATFYGQDGALDSVLDGSTFGEISIWEHNPGGLDCADEVNLVVDFTKVRSQGHEFGVHVVIYHGVLNAPAIATSLGD